MSPKWTLVTVVLVMVAVNLASVNGWQATAWTEFEFKGQNLSLTSSSCINLPNEFSRQVSSVNTHGRCVSLYDKKDCNGKTITLYPGSPYHNKLSEWIFNNKAMSMGPCRYRLCENCRSKLPNP